MTKQERESVSRTESLIQTEIIGLNMLAKKHSKESELASYVLGMTDKMMKDLEKRRIKK